MQNITFYGFAVLAVLFYAVQPVIAKKAQLDIPPFAFIAITMAVLALLALIASVIFERPFSFGNLRGAQIAQLLLFGVVNLFSFWMFLKAISGIPTSHYQIIGGVLAPIFTALVAYVFIDEALTLRFFLAIPIALIALYVALVR